VPLLTAMASQRVKVLTADGRCVQVGGRCSLSPQVQLAHLCGLSCAIVCALLVFLKRPLSCTLHTLKGFLTFRWRSRSIVELLDGHRTW